MSEIHITSSTQPMEMDTHTGKQARATPMTHWLALTTGYLNVAKLTIAAKEIQQPSPLLLARKFVYKVQDSGNGLSGGAIVGICVGAIVGFLILRCLITRAIYRINLRKQKVPASSFNKHFDLSDFPPEGSEISSWLNASSDESYRALAYQKQFPPPDYPAALPHELSQIAEKGLDAFAFVSLDPNWVQVDRDIVTFLSPLPNADCSVLSHLPLADPRGVTDAPPTYESSRASTQSL
ncbi:hypothetical protein HK096_010487, partial [Nowakowskiella sp. JEL0078]